MTDARDHSPAAIAYRPDIDGLRAVAVVSVVLFHLGISGLPGGFTGVDIFFVISGYLIGGQIAREAGAGMFRFAGFYVRRVRRILPALIAMIGAFLLFGLVALTPAELRELAKETVPALWGLSNLLFYTGGDYFAPAAERSPLLMTWSLGVEEQFYLLFPFVMLAAIRWCRGHVVTVVALLSALSFAGSLLLIRIDPQAAFYLLPTRAWELGLGAILALLQMRGRPALSALREAAGWGGIVLLLAALVAYRPAIAFPGWFAVLPVLGATLQIAAGGSRANRWLLSSRPVVFVGRISYSLYLWHWPVIYVARIAGEGAAPVSPLWLIAITVLLATASWRFVEQPLRHRVLPERQVLLRYVAVLLLLSGAAAALYRAEGWPGRLPALARAGAVEAVAARHGACLAPYGATAPVGGAACTGALADSDRPGLLLIGDSHADAIAPAIADAARGAGLAFGQMTKSSCLPLLDAARELPGRVRHRGECMTYQATVFRWIAAHPQARVIALAGYWSNGAQVIDGQGRRRTVADTLATTIAALEAQGRHVVLIQDAPGFAINPYARVIGAALPVRRWLAGVATGQAADSDDARARPRADDARAAVARIGAAPGRLLVDPARALCDPRGCRYADGGRLFYADDQHLTASGARAALLPGTSLARRLSAWAAAPRLAAPSTPSPPRPAHDDGADGRKEHP
ncbi:MULTISPECIES: acyltransferase family protein [Sphingomonas]|uniref:Acyltransferase n=3 Tax=Sphingomonas adhaesiva TaxID=28212 RepID=A0A2A4IAB7_9SPHN|nr:MULTISPECIES: acyltransferase family protein [Sphingomonas]PCG14732.1 acyltransferase [Sphingomonas adhaesiva]PZU81643.1 MAG: acyltransferase [Sphingomonas sp.]